MSSFGVLLIAEFYCQFEWKMFRTGVKSVFFGLLCQCVLNQGYAKIMQVKITK